MEVVLVDFLNCALVIWYAQSSVSLLSMRWCHCALPLKPPFINLHRKPFLMTSILFNSLADSCQDWTEYRSLLRIQAPRYLTQILRQILWSRKIFFISDHLAYALAIWLVSKLPLFSFESRWLRYLNRQTFSMFVPLREIRDSSDITLSSTLKTMVFVLSSAIVTPYREKVLSQISSMVSSSLSNIISIEEHMKTFRS